MDKHNYIQSDRQTFIHRDSDLSVTVCLLKFSHLSSFPNLEMDFTVVLMRMDVHHDIKLSKRKATRSVPFGGSPVLSLSG